eukprot:CAMPEP_0185503922 /NCGR_PEP_ID=MMETSP1366-20130426/33009_1 /TAXON_ID=38817 /ORGANISM="Gephyrocapsa oceanica, Strain RCC1303" /LENGTH=59 /DNA_ID=CAMNT_0028113825 /DNA_START=31 /DNA_END=210 /DNA_ORIENTATION=+
MDQRQQLRAAETTMRSNPKAHHDRQIEQVLAATAASHVAERHRVLSHTTYRAPVPIKCD